MKLKELLETIKDTSRDYVGMNGCLYQDITREELDLIVNEIERLNNIKKKAIHFINLNQDSKKLTLNYDDLKKLRGILKNDDYYLTIFEEQLKELKEK